jgi:hypothetical protein
MIIGSVKATVHAHGGKQLALRDSWLGVTNDDHRYGAPLGRCED